MDRRGASAQVGRLWTQGHDGVWRGCLYGIYGCFLGKTIASHALVKRGGAGGAARDARARPASLPAPLTDPAAWLSGASDAASATAVAGGITERAPAASSAGNQDVSRGGLDLSACEVVYPASLEGEFVDLPGEAKIGFTVLERNGHTHKFAVASAREQRKWIDSIAAAISGVEHADIMQCDRSALQLLYEGECAKTLELRAAAARLEAQCSEALADRDSLQTALLAALHRLSGADLDSCTRRSRTEVGETQDAVGRTQITTSQPRAQPPEPEERHGDKQQISSLKAQIDELRQQLAKQTIWARTHIAKQAPVQAAAEKLVRQLREVQDQAEITCDHASMCWQDQNQKLDIKHTHVQSLQTTMQQDQQARQKIIELLQEELHAAKKSRHEDIESLKAAQKAELKMREQGLSALSDEVCQLKAEIDRLKNGHLEKMESLHQLRCEQEAALERVQDEKAALEVELMGERKARNDEVKTLQTKIEALRHAAAEQDDRLQTRISELSFQLRLAREKIDAQTRNQPKAPRADDKEVDQMKEEIARLSAAEREMMSVFKQAHPVVNSLCDHPAMLERTLYNLTGAFATLQLELQRALQNDLRRQGHDMSPACTATSPAAASKADTPPVAHRQPDETSWLESQTNRIRSTTKSRVDCWRSPPSTPRTSEGEANKKSLTPRSGSQLQLMPMHREIMAARERAREMLTRQGKAFSESTPNLRPKKPTDDSSSTQKSMGSFRAAARAKLRR